jgi:hypothetical protein
LISSTLAIRFLMSTTFSLSTASKLLAVKCTYNTHISLCYDRVLSSILLSAYHCWYVGMEPRGRQQYPPVWNSCRNCFCG